MRLKFYLFLLAFGCFSTAQAQKAASPWRPIAPTQINLPESNLRVLKPSSFSAFEMDVPAMRQVLSSAPMEFSTEATQQPALLDLPMADGIMQTFKLQESPIMATELAAKYPGIKTYSGVASDGSGTSVRLGLTSSGFHAYMFLPEGGVQVVRPYAEGQQQYYMAYRVEDLNFGDLVPADVSRLCSTNEHELLNGEEPFKANKQYNEFFVENLSGAAVKLKKYRFAVAAKGEFTVYHSGLQPTLPAKEAAMNAIVTALNYIVAIQERDFSMRLELIANNDQIIFTDPATDPYTGNGADDWMGQNPGAINPIIGSSSYDIGHVFGVYVSGFAIGIAGGRVCNIFGKARGSSNGAPPIGEYFYEVAAHEICHQLSGSHTWNDCSEDANAQRAGGTAFEPGSGSTIMSYAGACSGVNNVVGDGDSYYHVASIEQVNNWIYNDEGNTCGTLLESDNTAPDITVNYVDGFSIPISTPFELKATATDAEDNGLTYCWEQYDLGPQHPLGEYSLTSPLFRSRNPSTSGTRMFPIVTNLVTNTTSTREILPNYSRDLKFKVTVRDNHPGVGGVSQALVRFKSTAQAGPFVVSYPTNSAANWKVGEYQTVTWEVANTDKSPVNCKTVNIRLSTNGGFDFPITLASGVPNTGQACVLVPNNVTTTARIRVEAADNIFFDISNANFRIENATQPDFSFCPGALKLQYCLPGNITQQIDLAANAGFSNPITFAAENLPAGVTAEFSANPVTPGTPLTLTLNFPANFPESTFDYVLKGSNGAAVKSYSINVTTVNNDFSPLALVSPVNGAINQERVPIFRWNVAPDANLYELQVATNANFEGASVIHTATTTQDSIIMPFFLDEGAVYYWRVRPVNECGNGDWEATEAFAVKKQSCIEFAANDLPKPISASTVNTVESKITVISGSSIDDINVTSIKGSHQLFRDLDTRLISPAGTEVILWADKCSNYSGAFNFGMDDSAPSLLSCPPANNPATVYKPSGSLATMNGQNSTGVWTLRMRDKVVSSGGQLLEFKMEVCGAIGINPPVIVNNNILFFTPGTNSEISSTLLKAEDPDNTAEQLIFTVMTLPEHGDLRLNWSAQPLRAGDEFTQADINNGALRFFDWGSFNAQDQFRFSVRDNTGGLVSGTFVMQTAASGTNEVQAELSFGLSPNPASREVRLGFGTALQAETQVMLFDAVGRQLRSFVMPNGALSLNIPVQELPRGVYTVMVRNSAGQGVKKLVVQ
jgi:subtilisin-like proprotein convertase family protein